MDKATILNQAKGELSSRIKELREEIIQLDQIQENEGKSSMGDKYETGAELVNAQREQLAKNLNQLEEMVLSLNQIKILKDQEICEAGSLLETKECFFLISIPFGKLEISGDKELFLISPLSPLAQSLLGRRNGENVDFRGRDYKILGIT